jgi:hypothetical protein
MFRSFFRVVVVAVVVLSFTLSLAQAGQTGSQSTRQPVAQTVMSGGWLGAAVQWLTGLVAGKPATNSGRHPVHRKGSCIDPWGTLCP